MRRTTAFLVVVSGPSGVGKTTLCDELVQRDEMLRNSVSATTRAPRKGEVEGVDYFFLDRDRLESLKAGNLLEWAEVHDHLYGTPRDFVEGELDQGRDVLLNIDVQGGIAVKKAFPEAVTVFILPPSFEDLGARMQMRGKDLTDEVSKRLDNARAEIAKLAAYDYIVINDDLGEAVDTLHAIIQAERCRRQRHPDGFIENYGADHTDQEDE